MQNSDFHSIRESRIEKEKRLIDQNKELVNYKIKYVPTDLGLVIRVQIPATLIPETLVKFDCFDDADASEDKKEEEEKQPGDFLNDDALIAAMKQETEESKGKTIVIKTSIFQNETVSLLEYDKHF
jgi:hypothetical protein